MKFYWIIILLNCLNKIIEKILIIWLIYLKLNILNKNQIRERKKWLIINIIIILIHDIQLANNNKYVISYLLLNMKKIFDYILIN